MRYEVRAIADGYAVYDCQLGGWADVPPLETESIASTVAESLNLLDRAERLGATSGRGSRTTEDVTETRTREPRLLRPVE